MKKLTILIAVLVISLSNAFSQTENDSITVKKAFGGYQFFKNDKHLNMNSLLSSMESNEQAYQQIKSAQSTYAAALVLSYAGGFMVGWPIGTALGGGDPVWAMAGIGAALIVVSIPLSKSFNDKAKQAVDIYNSGLVSNNFWDKKELNLSVTSNGLGLVFKY